MLPVIGTIIEAGLKIIDKVIPDPQAKAAAQLKLMELQQAGEFKQMDIDLQMALAQANINLEEAKSESLFKSGWRPAAGWACVGGLVYQIIARPLLEWFTVNMWGWTAPPSLEMDTLGTMLFGLLGLGAYRSYEKVKGAN